MTLITVKLNTKPNLCTIPLMNEVGVTPAVSKKLQKWLFSLMLPLVSRSQAHVLSPALAWIAETQIFIQISNSIGMPG